MDRAQKQATIDTLKGVFADAGAVVVTHNLGLTVAEMTDLRLRLRKEGATLKVVKNTLVQKALDGSVGEAGDALFTGPVAIAYARRHGMPLGRAGRMALSWVGDQDLVPHVAGLLKLGAVDVEVRFGEPVIFSAKSNRKEAARLVEARVRDMMRAALRGTDPSA